MRWWNVKHPAAYAERLARGVSPALAREVLGYRDQKVERILLEIRLVEGLPVTALDATGRSQVARLVADGLVDLVAERLVLTQRGRLLADASSATSSTEVHPARLPVHHGMSAAGHFPMSIDLGKCLFSDIPW